MVGIPNAPLTSYSFSCESLETILRDKSHIITLNAIETMMLTYTGQNAAKKGTTAEKSLILQIASTLCGLKML